MKILALAIFVGVGLVGCAAPKYNYTPETTQISRPPLDTVTTAYVGDQMLTQGKVVKQDALIVKSPVKVGMSHVIGAGQYLKTGFDEKADYYSGNNPIDARSGKLERTSALWDMPQSLMITKADNKICIITITGQMVCAADVPPQSYELGSAETLNNNSFQQTLIYSGRVGNKINIGYREFSSNLARPAFNNDVEYDLNESKTIGYKGALLEVIEATNQFIKYKVIKNFNLAQE